jgi:hypothetical protein
LDDPAFAIGIGIATIRIWLALLQIVGVGRHRASVRHFGFRSPCMWWPENSGYGPFESSRACPRVAGFHPESTPSRLPENLPGRPELTGESPVTDAGWTLRQIGGELRHSLGQSRARSQILQADQRCGSHHVGGHCV